MKSRLLASFLLLLCTQGRAQTWYAEISAGGMGYCGDLTQHRIPLQSVRPAAGFAIKYESGDLLNVRVGGMYGQLTADDKNNTDPTLRIRNLNFTTKIMEAHLLLEFNLYDPEIYTSYPYLFGGVGVFNFNPYSFDNNNKKIYLHPLRTEGQGLAQYPGRKQYALTQACLPLGLGWKWVMKNQSQLGIEFGYRITFTDYLDDVSKTYADPEVLGIEVGPLSGQMAYRKVGVPFKELGAPRGNDSKKDIYFFGGLKYAFRISRKKSIKKPTVTEAAATTTPETPAASTKKKKKGKKKKH